MLCAQTFSEGIGSHERPSTCAPFSSNCFNARLKLEVWLLHPPVNANGYAEITTHFEPRYWLSETSLPSWALSLNSGAGLPISAMTLLLAKRDFVCSGYRIRPPGARPLFFLQPLVLRKHEPLCLIV